MKLFIGNIGYLSISKKAFFCLFFLCTNFSLIAKTAPSILVKVCLSNGKPIENVSVLLNSSLLATSNKEGIALFKHLKQGEYAYLATCIGYEDVSGKFILSDTTSNEIKLTMQPLTLQLKEVTVVAQQKTMGSSSVIGQEAIKHLQPKSIADLFQLLPGSLTTNPSLNTASQASIRETSTDANNSLGTAIIIDGTPLSNDANLQAISITKSGAMSSNNADGMNLQTTASRGIDLRSISPDNVERMEVIRGIPSVEYGNLTSGVVIIKTKKGKTPLEVKLKTDPFSKLVYIGKGFSYKNNTTFNLGIDYSQSYQDTRRRFRGFDRITASASFSGILGAKSIHPMSFNVYSAVYSNINNYKSDAQQKALGLFYKNKNLGASISINGTAKINGFFSSLDYDISGQMAIMKDSHHNYVANPDGVISNSKTDGEFVAKFLTQTYYSNYFIEGIPYHFYARIKANKYIQLNQHSFSSLKIGIEYKADGNNGKGLMFNMNNPPQALGTQTLRPRTYKDIPQLNSLSAFAENNLSLGIGNSCLQLISGVRFSYLPLNKKQAKRSSIYAFEPRINAEYTFLNSISKSVFHKLSLTIGWGLAYKMPPLLYLYPDKAYFDNNSLSYRNTEDITNSLAVMTTKVINNTQNVALKPTKNTKFEVGLNARFGKTSGNITFFLETNNNEFGFDGIPEFLQYRRYQVPRDATNLSLNALGVSYTQNNNSVLASYKTENQIVIWNKPSNNSKSNKVGIEYYFNLGTCRLLSTSLNIDGAWFHIKRKNTTPSLQYINKLYDYIGVLPPGDGIINERINSNFRFITHLSTLKMVFTTTLQVVWHEKLQSFYETKKGKAAYSLTTDETQYQVNPLGFYNRLGQYQAWTNAHNGISTLQSLNANYLLYAFKADNISPWALLNFRLTKELGKVAELSFMANNFLNISKYHINKHSLGRRELYPDLYFGAEIKLKL